MSKKYWSKISAYDWVVQDKLPDNTVHGRLRLAWEVASKAIGDVERTRPPKV